MAKKENENGEKKAKILQVFQKLRMDEEDEEYIEPGSENESLPEDDAQDLFSGIPEEEPEEEKPEPQKVEGLATSIRDLLPKEKLEETEKEEKGVVPDVTVTETALDRHDSRGLTEVFGRSRAIWLVVGIVVLLILLIVILFSDRLYNQVEGKASYTLTRRETKVAFAEGNVAISLYGTQLLRCTQDGLQALSEQGTVVWDIPFTMSAPKLSVAGEYIAVADQLGMSLMMVHNGTVTCDVITESNILLHTSNELGQTAVVLSAKDGNMVNLYSAEGDLLMQRRTFQTTDGIPMAVALSSDGSLMGTVYVNYTGTELKSIITVFDLTESGSLLVDRVVGSVSYDGFVISDLKFAGSRLFFAGSEMIGAISTKGGIQKDWETKLSYRIEALVMTNDFVAVRYGEGLAGTAERIDKNIVIYNYSGGVISDRYEQDASYLGAQGDTIIIGAGRSYTAISSGGAVKWNMDSTEDYMDLVAFPGGRSVAALRRTQIDFYDVTLKGAVLEDE